MAMLALQHNQDNSETHTIARDLSHTLRALVTACAVPW